jgi:transposase
MVVVDGQGIPLGSHIDSASPAKVNLAEKTLENIKVPRTSFGRPRPRTRPMLVIADKAYDSVPLRKRLKHSGITLFSPYRKNRKKKRSQNLSMKIRCTHRWIVERAFSWFGSFKRLVTRYEHDFNVYKGFFHLACIMIVLRWL